MRSRGCVVLMLGAVVASCGAGCGSGQIDVTPRCGDGIVDPGEACDDANLQDGDGCSASCELEDDPDAGFDCVELLEAVRVDALAIANAEDGSALVAGWIETAEGSASHGWIGSFDAQGNQLWLREFMDATGIRALRASGDGFLALKGGSVDALLRLDADGNLESETLIPDRHSVAMVETDAGVVLAGSTSGANNYSDAWIGRLGTDGDLETLLRHDHAELEDEFVAVERSGDRVVALGRIGLVDPSDGDLLLNHVEGALLVELDDQGQELDRTFLMTDAEYPMDSWVGYDLTVSDDGTWIVAGQRGNPNGFGSSDTAWTVGLREGEVVWTHTIEPFDPDPGFPYAAFQAVEATDAVTLVGRVTQPEGSARVIVRLEPGQGAVISEHDELTDGGFVFTEVSSRLGGMAAFVGHSDATDSETVWRCNVQL